jgi:glycosyltransferase involved in cell wall biosynthesis
MIKAAIIIRSTAYTVQGGDTVQALLTAKFLADHRIDADIRLTDETIDYKNYSLLHFFNITRPADILHHIKKSDLPFVVSTVFVDYSEYDKLLRKGIPGMLFRFLQTDTIEYLKTISRRVLGKDRLPGISYLWKGHKRSVKEIMEKAGLLLPNSFSEYERLKRSYDCTAEYTVVPNCVDESIFRFDEHTEKDPKLVICAARIEGIKNQLNLIRALNNTDFKLVIIGAPAPNQLSYYNECRSSAAGNISFAGQVSQEQLAVYYQKAKVHILPSLFETTGLSSLEAAAMGCNIVITDRGDTKEYFGAHAFYCDPLLPESIYTAVEKAASATRPAAMQTKITDCYNGRLSGLRTAESYQKILNLPCS